MQVDWSKIAQMWALVAEMEGMKAENQRCELDPNPPAYGEVSFGEIAVQMRELSVEMYKED
jgi:hypothetical protein